MIHARPALPTYLAPRAGAGLSSGQAATASILIYPSTSPAGPQRSWSEQALCLCPKTETEYPDMKRLLVRRSSNNAWPGRNEQTRWGSMSLGREGTRDGWTDQKNRSMTMRYSTGQQSALPGASVPVGGGCARVSHGNKTLRSLIHIHCPKNQATFTDPPFRVHHPPSLESLSAKC